MGSEIKMNHYILCRRKCSTIPKISYLGIVAGQRKRFRCFARAADCIQVYKYPRADCIQSCISKNTCNLLKYQYNYNIR
jgi:hypothetical protein